MGSLKCTLLSVSWMQRRWYLQSLGQREGLQQVRAIGLAVRNYFGSLYLFFELFFPSFELYRCCGGSSFVFSCRSCYCCHGDWRYYCLEKKEEWLFITRPTSSAVVKFIIFLVVVKNV